jgi:SPP1 family predicted phage head-tail adaptor
MVVVPRKTLTPKEQLRHRVTIQEFVATGTDARGQALGDWVDVVEVWASVVPLAGRWAEYAHQLWESATVRVLIRFRADVTSANRLLFGSRVLDIGVVTNQGEDNHTLELLCTEAKT